MKQSSTSSGCGEMAEIYFPLNEGKAWNYHIALTQDGSTATSAAIITSLPSRELLGRVVATQHTEWFGQRQLQFIIQDHTGMMGGVPEPYRLLTNPLPDNAEVISRGREVYRDYCASCHGPSGLGDGEAGRELSPRPANLAWLSRMPMMMDDSYLYWTIAEGGGALGTAMPAHKDALSAVQIWSVIRFIQAGLPPS